MKVKIPQEEDSWKCDSCGQEKYTLYFLDKKQVCEDCRNKIRKESSGSVT